MKEEKVSRANTSLNDFFAQRKENEQQEVIYVPVYVEDIKALNIKTTATYSEAVAKIRQQLNLAERVRTAGVGKQIRESIKVMTAEQKKKLLELMNKIKV